jgi:hypothetical protein
MARIVNPPLGRGPQWVLRLLRIMNSSPHPWPPRLGVGRRARSAARSRRVLPVGAASAAWSGRVVVIVKQLADDPWPPGLGVGGGAGSATRSRRVLPVGARTAARSGRVVIRVGGRERKSRGAQNKPGHQRRHCQGTAERPVGLARFSFCSLLSDPHDLLSILIWRLRGRGNCGDRSVRIRGKISHNTEIIMWEYFPCQVFCVISQTM